MFGHKFHNDGDHTSCGPSSQLQVWEGGREGEGGRREGGGREGGREGREGGREGRREGKEGERERE